MEVGLFSNGERHNRVALESYDEDLSEIVTADRLGFHEAWVSEHIGLNRPDTMPAPELLICKAAAMTRHIRLGPAVRLLPLYHPVDVATQAAVCDHLTGGRYMFGFGSGGAGIGIMEQHGVTDESRHPRMLESLGVIRTCWTSEEPFDYDGQFWSGKGINVQPKPLQKPHPPIAVATGTDAVIETAAREGFMMITSQYESVGELRHKSDTFVRAAEAAGKKPSRHLLRISKVIHVTESKERAKAELRAGAGVWLEHSKRFRPKLLKQYLPDGGDVEDLTIDFLVDEGKFIAGDPDTVYRGIKAIYDEIGGFGTILLTVGKDWASRDKRARSLRLFAEFVAPRLAPLDPDQSPASPPHAPPVTQ